jgi:hypothetical protein
VRGLTLPEPAAAVDPVVFWEQNLRGRKNDLYAIFDAYYTV